MSQDIKVGDLVMIVKPALCCGSTMHLGRIDRVVDIPIVAPDEIIVSSCPSCGHQSYNLNERAVFAGMKSCLLSRLKKIDPPSTGDSLPTRKELEQSRQTKPTA